VDLTSDQKGSAAELGITHHAARLGVGVLRPLTAGHRYDLVFDVGGCLLRVQCKAAAHHGEVLVVNFRSCRRCAGGFVRRPYSADEVDLVAAYCLELDRSYLLPPGTFVGRPSVRLRLAPTKNNQQRGINWAEDFEFAATLRSLGAIAQLGERLTGSQKVTGSNPVGSIASA
jgi:PD-(D/E)XK nuclease superfamily protein